MNCIPVFQNSKTREHKGKIVREIGLDNYFKLINMNENI